MDHTVLRQVGRSVTFHDISTSRDIIILIDRFFDVVMKNKLYALSTPGLILVATEKIFTRLLWVQHCFFSCCDERL